MLQIDSLVRSETKFPWRMMCVCMEDVTVLLEFFKKHVVNIRKGAKVLLERIEDFGGPAYGSTVDFTNIHAVHAVNNSQTLPEEESHDSFDISELEHKGSVLR
jgi:ferritin-like protein